MDLMEKTLTHKRASRRSKWQRALSFGGTDEDSDRLDRLVAHYKEAYPRINRSAMVRFLLLQEEKKIGESQKGE